MYQSEFIKKWEKIVELGIATDNEIGLVIGVAGMCSRCPSSEDILDDIVYYRTGYPNFSSYVAEELKEELDDDDFIVGDFDEEGYTLFYE